MKIYLISAAVAIAVVVSSANKVPQNPVENNQSRPPKPSAILPSNKINFPVSHIEASQKSTAVPTSKATLVTSTASTSKLTPSSINTSTTTPIKVPVLANNTTATTTVDGMAYNTSEITPVKETANNVTSTTSVGGTAYNTSTTTPIKVPILANNTTATMSVGGTGYNTFETTPVKETANNATSTTSVGGTAHNTSETTPVKETANNATSTTSGGGTAAAQPAVTANEGEESVDNKHIINIVRPIKQAGKNLCPNGYTITANGDCTPTFPDE